MIKRLLLLFLTFVSFIISAQIKAKVIKISDGDTITVLLKGNIQKKLRIAEVDCPESGQAFGKNAKDFTSAAVFGKEITFFETDTDRYGRTIAKVYYNNEKYLSEELIKAGLGWWYHYFSKNTNLGKLEQEAREKKLGLWTDVNAISPWEFRKLKRSAEGSF